MKTAEKKQLVMIGIRRKGEVGFKLKTAKCKADLEKNGLPTRNCNQPSTSAAFV